MTLDDDAAAYVARSRLSPDEISYILTVGSRGHSGLTADELHDQAAAYAQYAEEVEQCIPSPVSVFMDTTTLYAAISLLKGKSGILSPVNLLDLDTFIRNVVLCDFIFHLPSGDVDDSYVNRRLKDAVLIPLPEYDGDRARIGFLNSLWLGSNRIKDWTRYGSEYDCEALARGWQVITGENVPARSFARAEPVDATRHPWLAMFESWSDGRLLRNLRKGAKYFPGNPDNFNIPSDEAIDWERVDADSYRSRFGSDAPLLTELQSYALRNAVRTGRIAHLFRKANSRAAFNSLLADALGLTYVPGLVRMPIAHQLRHNAAALEREIADTRIIRGKLSGCGITPELYRLPSVPPAKLPLFLAVLLDDLDDLSQAWTKLAEMRTRAAPYRRRRVALLDALDAGSRSAATDLKDALEADKTLWRKELGWPVAGTAVSIAGSMAGGIYSPIITGLAALLVSGRLDGVARAAILRRFRPREWYLTSLAATADGALRDMKRIEKLWQRKPPMNFQQDLERISQQGTFLSP